VFFYDQEVTGLDFAATREADETDQRGTEQPEGCWDRNFTWSLETRIIFCVMRIRSIRVYIAIAYATWSWAGTIRFLQYPIPRYSEKIEMYPGSQSKFINCYAEGFYISRASGIIVVRFGFSIFDCCFCPIKIELIDFEVRLIDPMRREAIGIC